MAFTNSSGYQNLAQGNFTPQIFSQKVQKFFRRASVVEDITNTDYAGEIENFGDTVKIIKEPTITTATRAVRPPKISVAVLELPLIVYLPLSGINFLDYTIDAIIKSYLCRTHSTDP